MINITLILIRFKKWISLTINHQWEISMMVDNKGRYKEFHRTCKKCNKVQYLGKPKKYDPVAYVWRDLTDK